MGTLQLCKLSLFCRFEFVILMPKHLRALFKASSILGLDPPKSFDQVRSCDIRRRSKLYTGDNEIWGLEAHVDPLADLMIHSLKTTEVLDIQLAKLSLTWKNLCSREARVEKILDHFLLFEGFLDEDINI
jgi:hypothetical protein